MAFGEGDVHEHVQGTSLESSGCDFSETSVYLYDTWPVGMTRISFAGRKLESANLASFAGLFTGHVYFRTVKRPTEWVVDPGVDSYAIPWPRVAPLRGAAHWREVVNSSWRHRIPLAVFSKRYRCLDWSESNHCATYRKQQESLANAKGSARQPSYIVRNSLNQPSLTVA